MKLLQLMSIGALLSGICTISQGKDLVGKSWNIGLGVEVAESQDLQSEPVVGPALWLTYNFDRGYLGTMDSKIFSTVDYQSPNTLSFYLTGIVDHIGLGTQYQLGRLPIKADSAYFWFEDFFEHKLDLLFFKAGVAHDSEWRWQQSRVVAFVPIMKIASSQAALEGEIKQMASARIVDVYENYDTQNVESAAAVYSVRLKGMYQFNDSWELVWQGELEHRGEALRDQIDFAAPNAAKVTTAISWRF